MAKVARRFPPTEPRRHCRTLRCGIRLTGPGTVLGGAVSVYAMYRASDGWVALAAIEPHFVAGLAAELEVDPMDGHALEQVFATRPAGEWERWAGERDLPLVRVGTILD